MHFIFLNLNVWWGHVLHIIMCLWTTVSSFSSETRTLRPDPLWMTRCLDVLISLLNVLNPFWGQMSGASCQDCCCVNRHKSHLWLLPFWTGSRAACWALKPLSEVGEVNSSRRRSGNTLCEQTCETVTLWCFTLDVIGGEKHRAAPCSVLQKHQPIFSKHYALLISTHWLEGRTFLHAGATSARDSNGHRKRAEVPAGHGASGLLHCTGLVCVFSVLHKSSCCQSCHGLICLSWISEVFGNSAAVLKNWRSVFERSADFRDLL